MLKVIDDGVVITLNGTDTNPVFIMAGILVVLAIGVLIVAMVAPVEITIGVMTLFAMLIFGFNVYKNRRQYQSHIKSGQIIIKNHTLIANGQTDKLTHDAIIDVIDKTLVIKDVGRSWYISGFDDAKEIHVAKSILEGQALQKREQAIRIL